MEDDSRFVTDPDRLRMLLAEKFVPWPAPLESGAMNHVGPDGSLVIVRPAMAPGFVSDSRFSRGTDPVIKRTNRQATRKWRALAIKTAGDR